MRSSRSPTSNQPTPAVSNTLTPTLTHHEKRLLQFTFDTYRQTGVWPKFGVVERSLVRELDAVAVAKDVEKKLSVRLNVLEHNYDYDFELPLRAIIACDGWVEYYQVLVDLIPVLKDLFFNSATTPQITHEDLSRRGWPEDKLRLGHSILRAEHVFTGSGGWTGEKQNWHYEIRRDIRAYTGVKTPQEYVSRRLTELKDHDARPTSGFAAAPASTRTFSPNTAFILMPMDRSRPDLDDVSDAIKEVCSEFGIEAHRADDVEHQGLIMDVVSDRIESAEFLVADLSLEKPNVYYEIGFAHAKGIRPILLRKKGERIHFDLSTHNAPEYENIGELKRILRKRLEAMTNRPPQIEAEKAQSPKAPGDVPDYRRQP